MKIEKFNEQTNFISKKFKSSNCIKIEVSFTFFKTKIETAVLDFG